MAQHCSCEHCGKAGVTCRCSGCHVAHYCDEACQKANWALHKAECNAAATVVEDDLIGARAKDKIRGTQGKSSGMSFNVVFTTPSHSEFNKQEFEANESNINRTDKKTKAKELATFMNDFFISAMVKHAVVRSGAKGLFKVKSRYEISLVNSVLTSVIMELLAKETVNDLSQAEKLFYTSTRLKYTGEVSVGAVEEAQVLDASVSPTYKFNATTAAFANFVKKLDNAAGSTVKLMQLFQYHFMVSSEQDLSPDVKKAITKGGVNKKGEFAVFIAEVTGLWAKRFPAWQTMEYWEKAPQAMGPTAGKMVKVGVRNNLNTEYNNAKVGIVTNYSVYLGIDTTNTAKAPKSSVTKVVKKAIKSATARTDGFSVLVDEE